MAKIWRDMIEPPSSEYIWQMINSNGDVVGFFKNKNGDWVYSGRTLEKNPEINIDGNTLADVAFSGDYNDLSNKPNQRTFKEFKNSWPTYTTLDAFCSTVISDTDAKVGNAYLGGLSCSGLPAGMGQGDVVVEIIGTNNNKVVKLTLTSTDVTPYHWEGCYWQGSFRGWKAWELQTNKVTSISNSSTDTQYPSAKAVYTLISSLESRIAALENKG